MRALLGFAVCLTLGLGVFLLWQSADPVQRDKREVAARYEQQRQALALEQERFALQQQQQAAIVSTPAYGVLGFVYAALPLAVAVLALYIAHDAYTQRRTPLVRPDARGLLPVARVQIEHAQLTEAFTAALAAFHQTQALAAAHQPLAERLTVHMKDAPAVAAPVLPALLTNAPETPSLPSIVELADTLATVKPGHLAFGKLANGDVLQLPLPKIYHALYHGDTGSGKTTAIDSTLVQLHRIAMRLPVKLYAGDYKRELAATWKRSPLFMGGIQTDPQGISDMLAELARQVRLRYATFEHVGNETGRVVRNYAEYANVTGERPDVVVCIIDELNAALEAAAKHAQLASNLKVLLQLGRGAGYFVQGGFQYMTSNVFGRDGSKQFITRAHFGAYDQAAVSMLFGRVDQKAVQPLLDGTPGRGLIRVAGQAQPVAFQALRCDEGDILDAIASVAPLRSTHENARATDRYENATETRYTASERDETPLLRATVNTPISPATVADNAPEVAVSSDERLSILSAVEELAEDGKKPSRRKVCLKVFGCEGGTPYKKVQAVLDQVGV